MKREAFMREVRRTASAQGVEVMSMERQRYTLTAQRDGEWWFLEVKELPDAVSQSKRLDQAAEVGRDLIGAWLDVPPDSFDVIVEPILADADLRELVEQTRDRRRAAAEAQREAEQLTRTAASKLAARGLSMRDIGGLLGVSFQRISQLRSKSLRDQSQ